MNVWARVQRQVKLGREHREKAKAIKGQRLVQDPSSKEKLLARMAGFHNTHARSSPATDLFFTIITEHYPPCHKPYSALQKISISQLRIGYHHVGEVLIVRVISKPLRRAACLAIGEDEHGQVAQVAVYHEHREADEVLPEGATIAIKQPFLQAFGAQEIFVRVDHPCDVVRLDKQLAPAEVLSPAFLLMRAEAFLRSRQYTSACKDCFAVLVADASNPQALFLLARAFYELGKYQQCLQRLEQHEDIDPLSVDAMDLCLRAFARVEETENGSYNFEELAREIETGGQQWLDVASFTRHVAVKDAGAAGRGLFATKSFKKGDIVCAEKALAVALTPLEDSRVMARIDLVSEDWKIGYDDLLYVKVMEELQRRPSVVSEFLKLYSPGYKSEVTKLLTVDGKVVLDTFHIARIVDTNSMSCGTDGQGEGMWLTTSYINHSCAPNMQQTFIGNLLVLKACENIFKGQELTMSYLTPSKSFEERQRQLRQNWGFVCQCTLCKIESYGQRLDVIRNLFSTPVEDAPEFIREVIQQAADEEDRITAQDTPTTAKAQEVIGERFGEAIHTEAWKTWEDAPAAEKVPKATCEVVEKAANSEARKTCEDTPVAEKARNVPSEIIEKTEKTDGQDGEEDFPAAETIGSELPVGECDMCVAFPSSPSE